MEEFFLKELTKDSAMNEYNVTETTVNQWVKEYLQSEGINPIPEVITTPNDIETSINFRIPFIPVLR